jgi:hypothetical protein
VFLCFDRVELSSGGWFFFRCSSFLRDNLCSHKSFFLFDQVFCSALVSLPTCLLESFTHNSGWHPDARTFHLQKQFPFMYMLGNAFQHFLTRADQEALLARVREHVHPQGCFLFGTRNPSPRNLFEARHPEPQQYTMPDGRHYVVTEQQEYDPITQVQHYTFLNQWLHPDGGQEEKTLRTALRYVFPRRWKPCSTTMGLRSARVTAIGSKSL